MTDTPLLQLQPAVPEALIQSDADALRFFVSGVEVFRLTPVGMEYKGQIVEDAGVAYREITEFFGAAYPALNKTKAALAQPEPQGPTDKELMELMPESMHDEFSCAARVCSNATGRRVKAGIFRVALNTAALEYARAVLDRWGGSTAKETNH